MKCVYHKQDETYRVMQRGQRYFIQRSDGSKPTRNTDCWYDIGRPKYSAEEAIAAMYVFKPLQKEAKA
jgi:hypothetical protein